MPEAVAVESDAPAAAPAPTAALPRAPRVCPFCAHLVAPVDFEPPDDPAPCPKCTLRDTPAVRRSVGQKIGPWFVHQPRNPTAPGLKLDVLATLVARGHVTGESVVRGPTTGQLWLPATKVRGVARLFRACWRCDGRVRETADFCDSCRAPQAPPEPPDAFLVDPRLPIMRGGDKADPGPGLLAVMAEAGDDAPAEVPPPPKIKPVHVELPAPRNGTPARSEPPPREAAAFFDGPAVADVPLVETDEPVRAAARATTVAPPRVPPPVSRLPALPSPAAKDSDKLLSVAELAAAFQLEMPSQRGRGWRAIGTVVRFVAWFTLFVVLLAAGLAAVLALSPETRRKARPHLEPAWTHVVEWVDARWPATTRPTR